jgi:hypothetical protein
MVAVEEKTSEQILAPEPLFYYKEFSLCKTRRYNSSYSYPSHLEITQKKQQ